MHAHLSGRADGVTTLLPVLQRYPDFAEFIATDPDPKTLDRLRQAESIGRPLGDDAFIERLEALTNRPLKPGKRGPKGGFHRGGRRYKCTVTDIRYPIGEFHIINALGEFHIQTRAEPIYGGVV